MGLFHKGKKNNDDEPDSVQTNSFSDIMNGLQYAVNCAQDTLQNHQIQNLTRLFEGTNPFTKKHHNVSFLVEGHYDFPHQWQLKAGYAMDFGSEKMLGHNAGMQITISKRGLLTKNK